MLLRLILIAAIGTMLQSRRCFASASTPAWTAAKRAGFFIESPIIKVKSPEPTIDVYYKMDFLQPSGSFKDRGIGTMIKTLMDRGPTSKLICSSGGNAGHAVATVGEKVGVPVDVFVPVTTMPMMVEKLKARGANVIVSGENWNAADKLAREALAADPSAHYIPPYDSPFIWEGNESIVDEVKAHFESRGEALPDLIILSVGGGGMLRGVQQGIKRLGLEENISVLAVETEGAGSFHAASKAGKVVAIPAITSIASSLGALSVTESVLDDSVVTEPLLVSDTEAVQACLSLIQSDRVLVEPACGAAIAALQGAVVPRWLDGAADTGIFQGKGKLAGRKIEKVVVIVCGGSAVNLDMMQGWKQKFSL